MTTQPIPRIRPRLRKQTNSKLANRLLASFALGAVFPLAMAVGAGVASISTKESGPSAPPPVAVAPPTTQGPPPTTPWRIATAKPVADEIEEPEDSERQTEVEPVTSTSTTTTSTTGSATQSPSSGTPDGVDKC